MRIGTKLVNKLLVCWPTSLGLVNRQGIDKVTPMRIGTKLVTRSQLVDLVYSVYATPIRRHGAVARPVETPWDGKWNWCFRLKLSLKISRKNEVDES